jgi:vancomycin resistance protein YoaR
LGLALTAQAPLVDRPPRDAALVVQGTSVSVAPAEAGTQVDLARLAQAILQQAGTGKSIEVPSFAIAPKVTTRQVEAMDVTSMIGSYDAYFPGSPPARLHNIDAAVKHLDGQMIAPGQIFSFDKQIGQITAQEGYVEGIVIQGDKDVPGLGGGICQVADTIFKGALYSGLPMVHWMNHQTLVPYYQPPGMDATVYVASGSNADVQFQNDTGHWLLIKFVEDLADARLSVRFFGANLGTHTVITGPSIIYHADGSADGEFHRTVTRGGKVVYDRTFHTHYKPEA